MERKATQSCPVQSTSRLIFEKVKEVLRRFDLVTLNRQIEACENLFSQDQIIDVAILGQVKAGKRSFINSLIGQNVLPVGVTPVTTGHHPPPV